MIAAIYARKSTEQAGVADDAKSVTRQIDHARGYAERKGWLVAAEHIYSDDGISGADFVKRPGLTRLLNALEPKSRPFDVLIMSEESRLGREQIETSYVLKQLTDAGVRVFLYLDDRERTLESAMDKVILSLTNFASEMEREKARQRTYDAMLRKAKALQVTGGKVYGYQNVRGASGVTRAIDVTEAAVIRRIFELYADGVGMLTIAHRLNEEHVAPPRGRGWAPSGIREMLHRPLYRGEVVWNRSQKIVKGGTKKQRQREASEWITLPAPELRIVGEARVPVGGRALPLFLGPALETAAAQETAAARGLRVDHAPRSRAAHRRRGTLAAGQRTSGPGSGPLCPQSGGE